MDKSKAAKGKLQPEVIIGMDHNIDLLKGLTHNPTHKFIDNTLELDLLPTVTCPSRITSHSATLINNIYVSESLHRDFESAIILNDMSDHLPLIAMLKQTKFLNKEPLTYESQCLNDSKLKEVNHCLMSIDWIGVLNGTTSNEKFNQFCDTVNRVLDQIAPKRTVKISAKW